MVRGSKVLREWSWEPREVIILYLGDMRDRRGKVSTEAGGTNTGS